MIETGLKELDKFLDGGIKDGLITSISGQSATGKTQLVFQICLNALHNGKEVPRPNPMTTADISA